jgi:hypothetical protein
MQFQSLSKPGWTVLLVRIIKKELKKEQEDKRRRKTITYNGRTGQ